MKNKIINYLFIFLITIVNISCHNSYTKNLGNKIDPNMEMSYDDYINKLIQSPSKKNDNIGSLLNIPPIPEISSNIISPKNPMIGVEKLVSLTVTEDVPLKDVLIELSRITDIDIELDPKIKGGIILKAKNKPFSEVIERICNLANLRFYNNNGILRIERDIEYLENYSVDFLNITRSNSNNSKLSTALASSNGGSSSNAGSSSGSGNVGSTSDLKSSYDGDLWLSIESDLSKILNIVNSSPKKSGGDIKKSSEDVLENPNSQSNDHLSDNNVYLSINKQASIISIYASSKLQKRARDYLAKVKKASSAQVLIEAKILEVDLNDNYQTGINWTELNNKILGFATGYNFSSNIIDSNKITFAKSQGQVVTGASGVLSTDNLQGAIDATQSFGNTRTLASPRIHAMNNQQAVLSFVENQVYFTLTITQTAGTSTSSGTTATTTTVNSTLNSVPLGVIVALQPSINLDTDEITMNIRPTITSSDKTVSDPAVQYIIATGVNLSNKGLQSSVPVVNLKEIDSILKIKSGQIMVIGGMMQESSINKDVGVPLLMSVPVIGNLFKSTSRNNNLTETVIYIKATIMPTDSTFKSDKDFYNNFARDKENIF